VSTERDEYSVSALMDLDRPGGPIWTMRIVDKPHGSFAAADKMAHEFMENDERVLEVRYYRNGLYMNKLICRQIMMQCRGCRCDLGKFDYNDPELTEGHLCPGCEDGNAREANEAMREGGDRI